ncbi:HlyD family efflux transporter periplasmic adaptor subunit [Reinekea forsetii]|uniref:Uncharacterized protein n=1 Tax=Reinekea forsetii TaxID=1336806 RepID=A0A2K8KSY4_9GAMM|nr:HlyD family secretion protein [Reinekea forsetii]ATX76981.1 hypothetical protein REIFOR_01844 [Reinekea forsetii]
MNTKLYIKMMDQQSDIKSVSLIALSMIFALAVLVSFLFVPIEHVVRTSGIVVPIEIRSISADKSGWVQLRELTAGNELTLGDMLGIYRAGINEGEHQIKIHHQRARIRQLQLEKKELDLKRKSSSLLNERKSTTVFSIQEENLNVQVEVIQKDLDFNLNRMKPSNILVEKSGIILDIKSDNAGYNWFNQGETILTLYNKNKLVVRAKVPSHKIMSIDSAKKVILDNEMNRLRVIGQVEKIFYAMAEAEGMQMMVDISIDEHANLKPSMEFNVSIVTDKKPLFSLIQDTFL